MATSLLKQLNNLKKSKSIGDDGVVIKYSLLYDINTAKSISYENSLNQAREGLLELITINGIFNQFLDTLYNPEMLNTNRENMTEEENNGLKKQINMFLYAVSPYLMLSCTHKALEWLLNRFSINIFDQDMFFYSIISHHETKVFARLIMLIDAKFPTSQWHWLLPLQDQGLPLVHQVLVEQCIRNKWWLVVGVCKFTSQLVKFLRKSKSDGRTHSLIFSFNSSFLFSILDKYDDSFGNIVDLILPFLFKGLRSKILPYAESCALISTKICSFLKLDQKYSSKLISNLLKNSKFQHLLRCKTFLYILKSQEIQPSIKIMEILISDPSWPMVFEEFDGPYDVEDIFKKMLQNLFLISSSESISKNANFFINLEKFIEIMLEKYHLQNFISSELIYYLFTDTNKCCMFSSFISQYLSNNASKLGSTIQIILQELKRNHPDINVSELEIVSFIDSLMDKKSNFNLTCNSQKSDKLSLCSKITSLVFSSTENALISHDLRESIIELLNDDDCEIVKKLLPNYDSLISQLDSHQLVSFTLSLLTRASKNIQEWDSVVITHLSYLIQNNSSLSYFDPSTYIFETLSILLVPSIFKELQSGSSKRIYEKFISISPTEFSSKFFNNLKESLKSIANNTSITPTMLFQAVTKIHDYNIIIEILKSYPGSSLICSICCVWATSAAISSTDFISCPDNLITLTTSVCNHLSIFKNNNSQFVVQTRKNSEISDLFDEFFQKLCVSPYDDELSFKSSVSCLRSIINHLSSFKKLKKDSIVVICSQILFFLNEGCCNYGTSLQFRSTCADLFRDVLDNEFLKDSDFINQLLLHFYSKHLGEDYIQISNSNLAYLIVSLKMFNHILSLIGDGSLNHVQFLIIFYCHLTNESSHVRSETLKLLKICVEKINSPAYKNVLNTILSFEPMIKNDAKFFKFILDKQIKNGKLNADIFLDDFINFISTSLNSYSLIVLDIIVCIKNKSKLCDFMLNFVDKLISCPGNCKYLYSFLEISASYFNSVSKNVSNQKSFIDAVVKWSTSQVEVENRLVSYPLLNSIDHEFFSYFSPQNSFLILCSFLSAIVLSDTFKFNQPLVNALKKWKINCNHFLIIITNIAEISNDPDSEVADTYFSKIISANFPPKSHPKLLIIILELLQCEHSYSNFHVIFPVLLALCEKITNDSVSAIKDPKHISDAQSHDYVIQLCLRCIHKFLSVSSNMPASYSRFPPGIESVSLRSIISILRSNQNYVLVDLSLKILSKASSIFPQLVIDYIMPLFTFMGNYAKNKDNQMTLDNICQAIDSIITSIRLKSNLKKSSSLNDMFMEIIYTFSDSFKHVPAHRHLPLFKSLVSSFGSFEYLGPTIFVLLSSVDSENTSLEFCSHLSSLFEIPDQISLVNYLFIRVFESHSDSTHISPCCQKRKKTPSSPQTLTDSEHVSKILDFCSYLISREDFKEKIMMNSDETNKPLSLAFRNILTTYFCKLSFKLKEYDAKPSFSEKFIKFILCFSPLEYLGLCNELIGESELSIQVQVVDTFYKLSSNDFYDNSLETPLSMLFDSFFEHILIKNASSGLEMNVTVCKKVLLSIKNIFLKIEDNKFLMNLIERLFDLSTSLADLSVTSVYIWVLSQLFKRLEEFSDLYTPRMLVEVIKYGDSLSKNFSNQHLKRSKVFVISLLKSLNVIFELSGTPWTPYIDDIFRILFYSVSFSSTSFLPSKILMIDSDSLNGLELYLFGIVNNIALKSSPDLILSSYKSAINSNINAISKNHTLLLTVISLHIRNLSPASVNENYKTFASFFRYALEYRFKTSQMAVKFNETFENEIFVAFSEFCLKLSESNFFEVYIKYFHSVVLPKNVKCIDNLKLITFYKLSNALFDRMKGVLLAFTSVFIPNLIECIDQICSEKDSGLTAYLFTTQSSIFEKCLMYDTKSYYNSSILTSFISPLLKSLDLYEVDNKEIRSAINSHIIPAIGYLSYCLKNYDLTRQLVRVLLKKLSHPSYHVRNIVIHSVQQIFNTVGDLASILLPEITPFLSKALNDDSSIVQNSAQQLYKTLENITGENISNIL